ncbi:hypothetical protein B0T17DRAFT_506397 [Bombardia bombarda]|uniref:NOT2/NOT3/NOT5 C-terminal domain-containing protein n=1 Tax=Bombardia bombarda TaxID=252184 RepID=A0AA39XAW9_9PEZI|nr:hypothetical protein B0T17DRAFT_506397 [Bombardia bombarda]
MNRPAVPRPPIGRLPAAPMLAFLQAPAPPALMALDASSVVLPVGPPSMRIHGYAPPQQQQSQQQQQQQQQQPQSGRAAPNRLPNGKLGGGAAAGWAFGAGTPMGGGANVPPGTARQLGANVSFAQSLSGSQSAASLDLSLREDFNTIMPQPQLGSIRLTFRSHEEKAEQAQSPPAGLPYATVVKGEFPSLSNNSQLAGAGQSTMWSSSGSRTIGGASQRGAGTPLSSQQPQQDDIFPTSRLQSAQGTFRFGNQGTATPPSQAQPNVTDDFPPLNRSATAEERGAHFMSTLGFGSTTTMNPNPNRAGNGLLNALSANTRAAEARSPTTIARPQDQRSPVGEDEARQKPPPYREDSLASLSSVGDAIAQPLGHRNPLGAIGNDPPAGKAKEDESERMSGVQDPLDRMAPIDKFGLKGLRTLMNNYPDYNALTCGIDPSNLGLDLTSTDLFSTQIYSVFDDVAPRPAIPKFRLPECYQVKNVQPIEAKIQSFNEETLMWIFYSCPGDIKQQMAAGELMTRNWRWHKKLQMWLTKDEMMVPQALSQNHERGYYVIWDAANWRKERREFTLYYADLDANVGGPQIQGVIGA